MRKVGVRKRSEEQTKEEERKEKRGGALTLPFLLSDFARCCSSFGIIRTLRCWFAPFTFS